MKNYFSSVSAIRDTFDAEGSPWFSRETMRVFGTTFPDRGKVYGGRFFVSHESSRLRFSDEPYALRCVTVRYDGMHEIETLAYFRTYGAAKVLIDYLLRDKQ